MLTRRKTVTSVKFNMEATPVMISTHVHNVKSYEEKKKISVFVEERIARVPGFKFCLKNLFRPKIRANFVLIQVLFVQINLQFEH